MSITYTNKVTVFDVIQQGTVSKFDSMFAPSQVEDTNDVNIVKYPISSSIFIIIAKTRLPNSDLLLRYDLTVHKEMNQDGHVMKSSYIAEESFGATLEEAYLDFLTSICDKYNSLQRRETKLSPRDKAVLENIRSLLTFIT
jgi:hypothetical protein